MRTPGFAAQASLSDSGNYYVTTSAAATGAVVPQLAIGLSPSDLAICREACAYCRWYGYACYTCWYCAIIIVLGGEAGVRG
jgi:hypothetical protein